MRLMVFKQQQLMHYLRHSATRTSYHWLSVSRYSLKLNRRETSFRLDSIVPRVLSKFDDMDVVCNNFNNGINKLITITILIIITRINRSATPPRESYCLQIKLLDNILAPFERVARATFVRWTGACRATRPSRSPATWWGTWESTRARSRTRAITAIEGSPSNRLSTATWTPTIQVDIARTSFDLFVKMHE